MNDKNSDNYPYDEPYYYEEEQNVPDYVYGTYYQDTAINLYEVVDENKDKEKMQKKEIILIAGLAVAVLIAAIFAITSAKKGLSISEGALTGIEIVSQTESTVASGTTVATDTATTTATPPMTTGQPSSSTSSESSEASSLPAQQSSTSAPALSENAEILKIVTDAINSLKDPTASFKGTKTQEIFIELTECSVPALVKIANPVIKLFMGDEVLEYDFTNGVGVDPDGGEEITTNDAFPPTGSAFALTEEGIASAVAEEQGENMVYTIVIVAETSSLDNPRPPHHNSAADTFDLSELSFPIGEITKADIEYPGATVSVTIAPDGKVIAYHERLETIGVGEGNAIGLSASGKMEGFIDESWVIEWK